MKLFQVKFFCTLLCAILLATVLGVQPTRAANFGVGDAAALIAAINTANSNGEGDVITLTANIILTAADNGINGLPVISTDGGNSLTIEGAGYTISRDATAPNFRIFQVVNGANLTLNNLTLSNGTVPGNKGGALSNNGGTVTINHSVLRNNSADTGGAIMNSAGSLIITNSTLSGNSAIYGGAIENAGSLTVNASTFSNNIDTGHGSHLETDGNATLTNSTLSGGRNGIFVLGGTLSLINTTVTNTTGNAVVSESGTR
jgi:hypothetical protein